MIWELKSGVGGNAALQSLVFHHQVGRGNWEAKTYLYCAILSVKGAGRKDEMVAANARCVCWWEFQWKGRFGEEDVFKACLSRGENLWELQLSKEMVKH